MLKTQRSSRINQEALALSKSSTGTRSANLNSKKNRDRDVDTSTHEISDILTKRYRGVSVYGAVMLILATAIVWTAVVTAEQVQRYHQDYMTLQNLKSDYRKLKIENQRLIIEQQTFSATPQIASRAVAELGMYSPKLNEKLILQPVAKQSTLNMAIDEAISEVYRPVATSQGNGVTGD